MKGKGSKASLALGNNGRCSDTCVRPSVVGCTFPLSACCLLSAPFLPPIVFVVVSLISISF